MKKLFVCVLMFGFVTGCETTAAESCKQLCDTYAAVGCENDVGVEECSASCDEPIDVCESEYNSALNCLANKTTEEDYVCDEFGESVLDKDVCANESVALFACVFSEME